jgi:hypothetical protein
MYYISHKNRVISGMDCGYCGWRPMSGEGGQEAQGQASSRRRIDLEMDMG